MACPILKLKLPILLVNVQLVKQLSLCTECRNQNQAHTGQQHVPGLKTTKASMQPISSIVNGQWPEILIINSLVTANLNE